MQYQYTPKTPFQFFFIGTVKELKQLLKDINIKLYAIRN